MRIGRAALYQRERRARRLPVPLHAVHAGSSSGRVLWPARIEASGVYDPGDHGCARRSPRLWASHMASPLTALPLTPRLALPCFR